MAAVGARDSRRRIPERRDNDRGKETTVYWEPQRVTDRQVIERGLREAVLSGDDAAWKLLYDSCCNRLFAYVYFRTGRDRSRAEELIQDCWETAVRRIRRFDPELGSFEQWMRGIADWLVLNAQRKWWRRSRWRASYAPDRVDRTADRGDALAVAEQTALALMELPERYRKALRAKYEEQLPIAEIAARWRESPKAVESVLARARAAFREAYLKLEGTSGENKGL